MGIKMKYIAAGGGVFIFVAVATVVLVLLVPQTPQFRETFKNKCEKFQSQNQSCEGILGTFEEAYVGKKPCNFSAKNYDRVLNANAFTHPSSKTMLWSDTKKLVHEFSKNSDCFITLEDTLLGSVLDGLKWCSLKGSKETFANFCEFFENNPIIAFWKNASVRFATYASGVVTAMLNGDKNVPYDPDSILASCEIKNLNASRVTHLNVVLVTDKKNEKKCDNKSLQNLRNELNQKGIGFNCTVVRRSDIRKCIKENNVCAACWQEK